MTTMTPTVLTLPFLGERAYLQGTTLLDGLLPLIPAGADIGLRMPHLLRTDRVRVDAGTDAAGGDAHAVLLHSGGTGRLEVRPLEPSPSIGRVPYDEAALWATAAFTTGAVELAIPSPFTFIATCVSLNKRMLLTDAPPQGPGQWLFAGLELTHHPVAWLPLRLQREAFIAGRMAKTGLHVGGARIGHLYFAWLDRSTEETA